MAIHLRTIETRNNPTARLHWKLHLAKGLYRHGYTREQVVDLLRFITWIMALPQDLNESFLENMHQSEEEKKMPYIMDIEQWAIDRGRKKGMEQGLQQGLCDAILNTLNIRFGRVPQAAKKNLLAITDVERLGELQGGAITISLLKEFTLLLKPQN